MHPTNQSLFNVEDYECKQHVVKMLQVCNLCRPLIVVQADSSYKINYYVNVEYGSINVCYLGSAGSEER